MKLSKIGPEEVIIIGIERSKNSIKAMEYSENSFESS